MGSVDWLLVFFWTLAAAFGLGVVALGVAFVLWAMDASRSVTRLLARSGCTILALAVVLATVAFIFLATALQPAL